MSPVPSIATRWPSMHGFKHRRFSAKAEGYGRPTSISTIEGLQPDDARQLRGRKLVYGLTSAFLGAVMVLGLIDAFGWVDTFGVDTGRVAASGGGYDLSVRYGTVSRPALATPFEITVTRADGFAGPVTLAVDSSYLEMWDENGLQPGPSAETARDGWVEWEFDPPAGTVLSVFFDARIEPAAQSGRSGSVAVIENGAPVVSVDFHTRVLP